MKALGTVLTAGLFVFVTVHLAFAEDFSTYLEQAKQLAGQGTSTLQQVDPTTIPNYTDNPSTSQYYTGVTQTTDDMAAPAQAAEADNPATAAVADDFSTRGRFEINNQSYAISNSKYIQGNANAITTGDTSTGVVCTNTQGQSVPTKNATCVRSQSLALSCHDRDVVTVVHPQPPAICQHVVIQKNNPNGPANSQLLKSFRASGPSYYIFLVAGPDAQKNCYLPNSFLMAQNGTVSQHPWQTQIGLSYVMQVAAFQGAQGSGAVVKAKANGGVLSQVSVAAPTTRSIDYNRAQHAIQQDTTVVTTDTLVLQNTGSYASSNSTSIAWLTTPQSPDPVVVENWVSDCDSQTALIHSDACTLAATTCTDGPSTKTIDGLPITETCWAKTTDYHCGQADNGSCDPLLAQGCAQQSSTCLTPGPGMCLAYQETFVCPLTPPSGHTVVCGQPTLCEGDDCAPPDQDVNQDFDQAAAGLATVNAEGEAVYDSQSQTTFKGEVMGCENDGVGFSNCCRNKGWGQDTHLAHCTDEEKKLGHAKEQGLPTYVGTKCEKRNKFGCYLYEKMYCVWPSLLSRDVQEQGRRDQLHIGFGSPDHPDCSGITVDQIQQIDFSLIDFSNAYEEIENNTDLPDVEQTEADAEQAAEQMASGGAQ